MEGTEIGTHIFSMKFNIERSKRKRKVGRSFRRYNLNSLGLWKYAGYP